MGSWPQSSLHREPCRLPPAVITPNRAWELLPPFLLEVLSRHTDSTDEEGIPTSHVTLGPLYPQAALRGGRTVGAAHSPFWPPRDPALSSRELRHLPEAQGQDTVGGGLKPGICGTGVASVNQLVGGLEERNSLCRFLLLLWLMTTLGGAWAGGQKSPAARRAVLLLDALGQTLALLFPHSLACRPFPHLQNISSL